MAAALSALASVAVVEAANIQKSEMKNSIEATSTMRSPIKAREQAQNLDEEMMTSTPSVHDHEPVNDSPISCSASQEEYVNESDFPRRYRRGRRCQRTKYSAENVKRTLFFERTTRRSFKRDWEEGQGRNEHHHRSRPKRGKFVEDGGCRDSSQVDKLRILANLATTPRSSKPTLRSHTERNESLTRPKPRTKNSVAQKKEIPDESEENRSPGAPVSLQLPIKQAETNIITPIRSTHPSVNKEESPLASVEQLTSSLKERLMRCLRLKSFNRWSLYEWFYAAVDRDFFYPPIKPFPAFLESLKLPQGIHLTRHEWGLLKAALGTTRRFCPKLVKEEKQDLKQKRKYVRKMARRVSSDRKYISVGDKVTAHHPKDLQIRDGTIVRIEGSRCSVQFDKAYLGVHRIKDFHIRNSRVVKRRRFRNKPTPVRVDENGLPNALETELHSTTNTTVQIGNEHKANLQREYVGSIEPSIFAHLKILLDELEYQLVHKDQLIGRLRRHHEVAESCLEIGKKIPRAFVEGYAQTLLLLRDVSIQVRILQMKCRQLQGFLEAVREHQKNLNFSEANTEASMPASQTPKKDAFLDTLVSACASVLIATSRNVESEGSRQFLESKLAAIEPTNPQNIEHYMKVVKTAKKLQLGESSSMVYSDVH